MIAGKIDKLQSPFTDIFYEFENIKDKLPTIMKVLP